MKKIVSTIIFVFLLKALVFAQTTVSCKADPKLPDTAAGVFPLPFSATNPKGGISDTACLNAYFNYTFTIAVPKTFNAGIIGTIPITNIQLSTTTAVKNMPTGLTYTCNPPNCTFPAGTKGCVIIYGTPTNPANVGRTDLQITGLVNSILPIEVTFPNAELFAAGNYYLHIKPAGSPACKTSSTRELAATKLKMINWPNPFSGSTEVQVEAELRGRFEFRVYDFLGKMIHRREVQLARGINRISYDANNLAPGVYVYTITDGVNSASRKMIVE